MTKISVADIIRSNEKMIRSGVLSKGKVASNAEKISKMVGIDELLQCLNPATFDFACVIDNVDWLINSTLNNVYLSCSLGDATPDSSLPARSVSSGSCMSWFGLPVVGQPQRCLNFDSATKAFQACKPKCDSLSKSVEQSGCDGTTIYCWCI